MCEYKYFLALIQFWNMKVFICNRHNDQKQTSEFIYELIKQAEEKLMIFQETEHSDSWKISVEDKIKKSDFVIFVIGENTFKSQQIIWEYELAKSLNKTIIGFSLSKADHFKNEFVYEILTFSQINNLYDFIINKLSNDRLLKIEQYKIMVKSTEQVTESRLKVNNLFFTITSSVLSVALLLEKTYSFSLPATVGVFLLTIISYLICKAWEKLINSYKNLNTGKFKVIEKLERELETNMFGYEWDILISEVKYESNSDTEINIIKYFKKFIIIIGFIELGYIICLIQHILYYNHF